MVDCGTHSADPVDYPDLAYAVARLVSSGQAWRGIVIDGAGIGSAMAANKVPGVRAALCYDHSSAVNSREHNDANVLTSAQGSSVLTWPNTSFRPGWPPPSPAAAIRSAWTKSWKSSSDF